MTVCRIALIDGPLPPDFPGLAGRFYHGLAGTGAAGAAALHATALGGAILAAGVPVAIDNHVVFDGGLGCRVEAVVAALAVVASPWERARMINTMSPIHHRFLSTVECASTRTATRSSTTVSSTIHTCDSARALAT